MRIASLVRRKMSENEVFDLHNSVVQALNGGIGLNNMSGVQVSGITPNVANTEFTVTHNLGYIPTGWKVLSVDQAATIYKGVTAWSNKTVSLKCNGASVNFIIFVL